MDNSIPRGRIGKREEIGKDGALVRRVVMISYALPSELPIRLKHDEMCLKGEKNEEIMSVVEMANPKVISELEMVLKGVMITIGYCNGCGIDKEQSEASCSNTQRTRNTFVRRFWRARTTFRWKARRHQQFHLGKTARFWTDYNRRKGSCTKTMRMIERPMRTIFQRKAVNLWLLTQQWV